MIKSKLAIILSLSLLLSSSSGSFFNTSNIAFAQETIADNIIDKVDLSLKNGQTNQNLNNAIQYDKGQVLEDVSILSIYVSKLTEKLNLSSGTKGTLSIKNSKDETLASKDSIDWETRIIDLDLGSNILESDEYYSIEYKTSSKTYTLMVKGNGGEINGNGLNGDKRPVHVPFVNFIDGQLIQLHKSTSKIDQYPTNDSGTVEWSSTWDTKYPNHKIDDLNINHFIQYRISDSNTPSYLEFNTWFIDQDTSKLTNTFVWDSNSVCKNIDVVIYKKNGDEFAKGIAKAINDDPSSKINKNLAVYKFNLVKDGKNVDLVPGESYILKATETAPGSVPAQEAYIPFTYNGHTSSTTNNEMFSDTGFYITDIKDIFNYDIKESDGKLIVDMTEFSLIGSLTGEIKLLDKTGTVISNGSTPSSVKPSHDSVELGLSKPLTDGQEYILRYYTTTDSDTTEHSINVIWDKSKNEFKLTDSSETPDTSKVTVSIPSATRTFLTTQNVTLDWKLSTPSNFTADPSKVEVSYRKVGDSSYTKVDSTNIDTDDWKASLGMLTEGNYDYKVEYTYDTSANIPSGSTLTATSTFNVVNQVTNNLINITLNHPSFNNYYYYNGLTNLTWSWSKAVNSSITHSNIISGELRYRPITNNVSYDNWTRFYLESISSENSVQTHQLQLIPGTTYQAQIVYKVKTDGMTTSDYGIDYQSDIVNFTVPYYNNSTSPDGSTGGGTTGGGSSTTIPGSVVVNVTSSNSTLSGTSAIVSLPTSLKPNTSVNPSVTGISFTDKDGKEQSSNSIDFRNVTASYDSNGKLVVKGLVPGKKYNKITVNVTNNNGVVSQVTLSNFTLDFSTKLEQYMFNAYSYSLKRLPDEDGYNFHNGQLKDNKTSLRDFVLNLLNEKEFTNDVQSDEDVIRRLYLVIVDREVETSDALNFWIKEYKDLTSVLGSAGEAKKAVADRMVNENELKEKASTLGVTY